MQRKFRKLVTGTVVIVAALAASPALPAAAAAPPQDPEITVGKSDDHVVARRRCRWVWRHGLVCETKTTTVNP